MTPTLIYEPLPRWGRVPEGPLELAGKMANPVRMPFDFETRPFATLDECKQELHDAWDIGYRAALTFYEGNHELDRETLDKARELCSRITCASYELRELIGNIESNKELIYAD